MRLARLHYVLSWQVFNSDFLLFYNQLVIRLGRSPFLLQNRFLALVLPSLNRSG